MPGRALNSARHNQFVADDLASHGGPGEAINAAELFLSGLTVCAVLMMERLARASSLPLQKAEVTAQGSIDTEAVREGPAVLIAPTCVLSLSASARPRRKSWSRLTNGGDRSMVRSQLRP
jgi:hypothetical protein